MITDVPVEVRNTITVLEGHLEATLTATKVEAVNGAG